MTERPARQAIIDAMSHLLETQGYHGTGLSQIIRESGAPRGSLYYYFPDGKEELAAEAVLQRSALFAAFAEEQLAAVDDATAAILRFIDQVIHYFETSNYCGGAPIAAVALETAASSPRLRVACADAYATLHAPFIRKLEDEGVPPLRARSLAVLINSAIEGATVLCRIQQSTEPLRQVRAEVQKLLQRDPVFPEEPALPDPFKQ